MAAINHSTRFLATLDGTLPKVSWILPTATARYVVDLSADGAGPVLQDWTDGEIRTWAPSDQHSFDTPPDRLPSELSALGTRQVRGADLIVDHGGALVGARLVWPPGGVDFTEDGLIREVWSVGGTRAFT